MRVARWKADKIFMNVKETAIAAVRESAEEVAERTRASIKDSPEIRPPKFSDELKDVSFTPTRGRNKDKLVSFKARVWMGRKPGDLRRTVRVLEKPDRRGNFRVIAGNYKIYWARFAEYGTSRSKRAMRMREAFSSIKPTVSNNVEKRVRGALS